MAARDLSDRELCLGLAERLGWAIEDEDYGRIVQWPGVGLRGCEEFLTPAGCFAVLAAMRERGWLWTIYNVMPSRKPGWTVELIHEQKLGLSVSNPDLSAAICEAAYDALGAQ